MPAGTVKDVISKRGFRLIASTDGKEYFFHRSGLDQALDFDCLSEGEQVAFQVEQSPTGPRALKVRQAS